MGEYYDVYPKDHWRDTDYKVLDKFSLKGKKGFVTGGTGGIGRNTAAVWAENGADVAIVDLPSAKDTAESLAKELSDRYGVNVCFIPCDVSDNEQIKALKVALKEKLGTVDICHSNAGVCLPGDDADVSYEVFKKTIDIDLVGAFMCAQVAQQIMREDNHGGSIIMTSSLSGYTANNFANMPSPVCAYGAAKAGVSMVARYMGAALAPFGIRVNTIAPGYVWSGIHEGVMDKAGHDLALAPVPIKRFGLTEDLAGAILYLSSDASSYVTGINIPIDGGYSIF